jgi:hypothetical protein
VLGGAPPDPIVVLELLEVLKKLGGARPKVHFGQTERMMSWTFCMSQRAISVRPGSIAPIYRSSIEKVVFSGTRPLGPKKVSKKSIV